MVQIGHFTRQAAIGDLMNELLGDGNLLLILAVRDGYIHFGTHAGGEGGDSQRLSTKVDSDANRLVNGENRTHTVALHSNLFAVDNFAATDDGRKDDIDLGARVDNDRLEFGSIDLDGDFLAIENVHLLFAFRNINC